ncbi:MAG: type II toxin-antitoxin system RelE family toxin [Candidatus Binatia bacterium]
MAPYQLDIPPHIAEIFRHLAPDLKRGIKQALRSLSADPFAGTPLIGELAGLWRIKVRRFRIVYEFDRKARMIRIFAIGHRREIYEQAAALLRKTTKPKT